MSWLSSVFKSPKADRAGISETHCDDQDLDPAATEELGQNETTGDNEKLPAAEQSNEQETQPNEDQKQPAINAEDTKSPSEIDPSKHPAVTQMDTKIQVITRATLNLGDNFYSSCKTDADAKDESSPTGANDAKDEPKHKAKAPPGWNEQYNELFTLLKRGLLGYNNANKTTRNRNNVSAMLMGPRGQGKSFVLERCLNDLSLLAGRQKHNVQPAFRVVRLNGLMYAGDNAAACAREIARQIGEMAGGKRQRVDSSAKKRKRAKLSNTDSVERDISKSATPDAATPEAQPQQNRISGFNSNISLLDEALRTARIDNIPILIILEELNTFFSNKTKVLNKNSSEDATGEDRQLLLYHLLDRVADLNFLVSLVGITTDLGMVSKFEKRVLSRAEGTSKFIYFGRMISYNDVIEGLLMGFHCHLSSGEEEVKIMEQLRSEVEDILLGDGKYKLDFEEEMDDSSLVRSIIVRNYEMRSWDMRWFCRVIDVALGYLAMDIEERKISFMQSLIDGGDVDAIETNVKLTPSHVAMALDAMGARVCDIVKAKRPGIPTSESLLLKRWERLIGGTYRGNDPRICALFDLSGPQIAILMAARRILARDNTRTTEDDVNAARKKGAQSSSLLAMAAPLTYQRINDEYTTSFVASGRYTLSSDRYPSHLLYRAFTDLIELDLVRLKKDHSKGGPLQFEYCDLLSSGANLQNLPLVVTCDLENEFLGLLKGGALNCSTVLREWGLRMN